MLFQLSKQEMYDGPNCKFRKIIRKKREFTELLSKWKESETQHVKICNNKVEIPDLKIRGTVNDRDYWNHNNSTGKVSKP